MAKKADYIHWRAAAHAEYPSPGPCPNLFELTAVRGSPGKQFDGRYVNSKTTRIIEFFDAISGK